MLDINNTLGKVFFFLKKQYFLYQISRNFRALSTKQEGPAQHGEAKALSSSYRKQTDSEPLALPVQHSSPTPPPLSRLQSLQISRSCPAPPKAALGQAANRTPLALCSGIFRQDLSISCPTAPAGARISVCITAATKSS